MKKIFIALILSLTATVTLANNYCNQRPTQQQVNVCYNAIIEQAQNQHQKTYDWGMNSNISQAAKNALRKDTDSFIDRVNSQCRNSSCVYESLIARKQLIINFVNENRTK